MKQRIICKTLVVAIIILFLGLAIQPSVAVQSETEIDIEPKDYLFQTIIDITNNPDVKELFEQYKPDIFNVDIDRSVYRKLFFRNPRLMFNTLFTKPSMSVEYLNKCYNNGIGITNILGEDKVIEMMENVEVTDTKFFDELNNIISKDEELSGRFETLKEMNKELKSDILPIDKETICFVLLIILVYEGFKSAFFGGFYGIFKDFNRSILEHIMLLLMSKSFWLGALSLVLMFYFDCINIPPEHINL